MDHIFVPSQTNADSCIKCRYNQRAHTTFAQCEHCVAIGVCDVFTYHNGKSALVCKKCYEAEEIADAISYQAPDLQEARLANHNHQIINLLAESKNIDESIQLDTDIFNAKTKAFVEIFNQIDADDTITNKALAKAEFVHARHKHLQTVIFRLKAELNEAGNEQRSAQVSLNQLANQLRAEDRERLKIENINYQPSAPKSPKPKSSGTKQAAKQAQKISAKELVEQANVWAAKIGMPGTVIHMRMLAKNMSAEEATRTFAADMGLTVKE